MLVNFLGTFAFVSVVLTHNYTGPHCTLKHTYSYYMLSPCPASWFGHLTSAARVYTWSGLHVW